MNTPTAATRALGVLGCAIVLAWMVRQYDIEFVLVPLIVSAALIPLLLRPELATLVVLFLLYTNLPVAGYQVYGLPQAASAAFTLLLALPLAGALIVRRETVRTDTVFRLMLGFGCVMLLSSLFAREPTIALTRIMEFAIEGLVLYWLMINVVRGRSTLRRALWTVVAAGSLLGTLSLYQAVTGSVDQEFAGLARRQVYVDYMAPEEQGGELEAQFRASRRAGGPVGEPNRYAQMLLVLLPLAAVLRRQARNRREANAATVALVLLLAGVVLTYSRGGLLVLALVVTAAIRLRWIRIRHVAIATACAIVVAGRFAPGLGDRIVSIGSVADLLSDRPSANADGAIRGRATEMMAALYTFVDHPILGVGPGHYMPIYSVPYQQSSPVQFRDLRTPRRAHNLYLEIAAELGMIGLISFLAIAAVLLHHLNEARIWWTPRNPEYGDLATAFILAIGTYLASGLFLHLAYERYYWLLLALGSAALYVLRTAPAIGRNEQRDPVPLPISALRAAYTGSVAERVVADASRSSRPQQPGPRIAYIVSRFPKLTETFVLNEIVALESMGIAVELYPLLRHTQAAQHPEAWRWTRRAHFHPFVSLRILHAQLFFLRRDPAGYVRVWRDVLREAWGSRNFFIGALGIFPKAVRFAYEMRRSRVTHIHAHFANHPAVAALIVHRLTGIPFSFTAHGSDLHVDRRMLCMKARAAEFVVGISNYNRDLIIKHCGVSIADRIHVIHCGIDPKTFAPGPTRPPGGVLRIVCVASFEEVKGHRYLVEACQDLAERGIDFRCELVGTGPLMRRIRRDVALAGLYGRVRMTGGLPRGVVAELCQQCDIAVLASCRTPEGKREGIPVALMEAMACGLPVVASDISGIPELVRHGRTGMLVPPRDSRALADALATLAADPSLRGRLGRAGREHVLAEFDLHANTRRLLALFARDVVAAARQLDTAVAPGTAAR